MLAVPSISAIADTAAAAPVAAPAAATKAKVQGTVTAVDATAKSVTVSERKGGTTTFTVAPAALIAVRSDEALADINVGDKVRAMSASVINEGDTTVDTLAIEILPATGKHKEKGTGYHKKAVDGVVATVKPLTITTPGGVTVTLLTSAATVVSTQKSGSFSDIAVGLGVWAEGDQGTSGLVANRVRVFPATAKSTREKKNKLAP